MNDFKKMWDFPVREGVTFQNANRIHPLMQTRVEKLIQSIRKDDKETLIDKLIEILSGNRAVFSHNLETIKQGR